MACRRPAIALPLLQYLTAVPGPLTPPPCLATTTGLPIGPPSIRHTATRLISAGRGVLAFWNPLPRCESYEGRTRTLYAHAPPSFPRPKKRQTASRASALWEAPRRIRLTHSERPFVSGSACESHPRVTYHLSNPVHGTGHTVDARGFQGRARTCVRRLTHRRRFNNPLPPVPAFFLAVSHPCAILYLDSYPGSRLARPHRVSSSSPPPLNTYIYTFIFHTSPRLVLSPANFNFLAGGYIISISSSSPPTPPRITPARAVVPIPPLYIPCVSLFSSYRQAISISSPNLRAAPDSPAPFPSLLAVSYLIPAVSHPRPGSPTPPPIRSSLDGASPSPALAAAPITQLPRFRLRPQFQFPGRLFACHPAPAIDTRSIAIPRRRTNHPCIVSTPGIPRSWFLRRA
ncbi:hypothetical protein C8R44DRAFT_988612 [Mycena epipterygia]|nr:hypothetical protein C8R44DRAFT_988612 [Mycena epipterygia]